MENEMYFKIQMHLPGSHQDKRMQKTENALNAYFNTDLPGMLKSIEEGAYLFDYGNYISGHQFISLYRDREKDAIQKLKSSMHKLFGDSFLVMRHYYCVDDAPYDEPKDPSLPNLNVILQLKSVTTEEEIKDRFLFLKYVMIIMMLSEEKYQSLDILRVKPSVSELCYVLNSIDINFHGKSNNEDLKYLVSKLERTLLLLQRA